MEYEQYEVVVPDEPTDGLFRARVYAWALTHRELIAYFTAPTWRHVQDEAKAICGAHERERTFVFNDVGDLVPKRVG